MGSTTLESGKSQLHSWTRVADLERQADVIARHAIATLFTNKHDPMYVIKWKDVYGLLEKTVDRTKDVVGVVEGIASKGV